MQEIMYKLKAVPLKHLLLLPVALVWDLLYFVICSIKTGADKIDAWGERTLFKDF